MFRKVDCVLVRVPDLDAALGFYRDRLGLRLVWRRDGEAAGLAMTDSETEFVLLAEPGGPETDLLVDSADDACRSFSAAGGRVETGPFDVPVGRCAVVRDPWGNRLFLIDLSRGRFRTDAEGNVVGVGPPPSQ